MHGIDTSVPHFFSCVRGTRIVVTPEIVSEVLHVPRVVHPSYPGYELLRIVSKDELSFLFCETTSSWGDHQNTPCSSFAKGLRFLNMVMTFILHPLSHYNTITESRARFLLSLIKDISIDFLSHFILSLIDVYRDTTTRDMLIFPLAIMRILRQFSVSFLASPPFSVIGNIDRATVRRSEAQLWLRRPWTEIVAPPTSTTPSTSAPSSSVNGVTLKAIMAHLVRMDACLDTLSDELCQVNSCVGRIAWRQAVMGGFTMASFPSPATSEDDDNDSDDNDADEDDGASSPSDDKCLHDVLALCHSWQKGEVVLRWK